MTNLRRIYLRVCFLIAVMVTLFFGWKLVAFYVVGSAFAWWLLYSLTQAMKMLRPGNDASAYRFLRSKVWWRYPLAAVLIAWVCRYTLADTIAFIVGVHMVPGLITALAVRHVWHDHLNNKRPVDN